ncbi:hypothetical protein Glove_109g254 [Diversispora epigaea]|uniref:Uncharacterized protein n=1 Tax=Diversispora epigaea TaxID=1348612 RepID=A0A397JAV4_9GLOM|nr:hypothetical protein Glove_109g254 [Diversispora epigaea]
MSRARLQHDSISNMQLSRLEGNNGTLNIAELACNNYENYEENELENDENNDIQEELLQNTRVRGTNSGSRGQS